MRAGVKRVVLEVYVGRVPGGKPRTLFRQSVAEGSVSYKAIFPATRKAINE